MMSQNQIFGKITCAVLTGALWLLAGQGVAQELNQALQPGGVAVIRGIVDGDTVTMQDAISGTTQIRLVGIQAPKLQCQQTRLHHVSRHPADQADDGAID